MKNLTGISALSIIIFVGLACSGNDGNATTNEANKVVKTSNENVKKEEKKSGEDETVKANEIVHEANVFVAAANESVLKAKAKFEEYEIKVDAMKNDQDLKAARAFAKDFMPLYDSMSENFTRASAKFDEASKLNVNEKHREYLEAKAREMKLRGEYSADLKKIPQALIDSDGEKAYRQAVDEINKKVNKTVIEAEEFGKKASQIQKDNPEVMEQKK